jgi:hypothetical protein
MHKFLIITESQDLENPMYSKRCFDKAQRIRVPKNPSQNVMLYLLKYEGFGDKTKRVSNVNV